MAPNDCIIAETPPEFSLSQMTVSSADFLYQYSGNSESLISEINTAVA